jgi:hypothetical protein
LHGEITGNETDLLFGKALGDLVHNGCGPGTTLEIGKRFKELLCPHACKWHHVTARMAIGAMAGSAGGRKVARNIGILG